MEWKEYQIQDVCRLINGRAYSNDEMLEHGKYKIVRVGNLSGGNSTWFYSDLELPADKYCHNGDLLFAWACTFGPHIWKEDNTIFHYHIWKIVEDKDVVDRRFFYYYLKFATGGFLGALNGSVMVHITKSSMEKMIIRIPKKLEDQRRIASILSSLDRKIELNNKINADLEEMAQAIFKNWFVDFEPFKDGKFVDSELGMIPEGWKVGTIGDIVEFQNGFTFSSKDFSENGEYKIITIKSVQDGCLVTEGSSKVTEYPTKMPAYCKLQSGDILLSLTGNVGRCCLVTETNLLLNQRVAKIKAKECYDNSFSYALFRLKETKELLISISRGTAQANLSPVEASKLPMVIPSEDARKSFSMISDSIMNKIISIHIENSRLSLLRDTLLPRLMSGELEVPE